MIIRPRKAFYIFSLLLTVLIFYVTISGINMPSFYAFYFPELILRLFLLVVLFYLIKFQLVQFKKIILDLDNLSLQIGESKHSLEEDLIKRSFLMTEYFTLPNTNFIITPITHHLDEAKDRLDQYSNLSENKKFKPSLPLLILLTGVIIALDGVGEIQKLRLKSEADIGKLSTISDQFCGTEFDRNRVSPYLRIRLCNSSVLYDVNYYELKEEKLAYDMIENSKLEIQINHSQLGFIDPNAPSPDLLSRYFQHPEIIKAYSVKGPLAQYTKLHSNYLHFQDILITVLELSIAAGLIAGGIFLYRKQSLPIRYSRNQS